MLIVAAAFISTNAVAFSLVRDSAVLWSHLYYVAIWLSMLLLAHLVLRAFRPGRSPFFLPVFALAAGWGLVLQDRLAPNFLARQTLWFTLATLAMLGVAVLPRTLQPLYRYRYLLLVGGLILLAFTLAFGVNPSGSGAALWLPMPFPFLGLVYFQPSELLKLLLVIFLASYFTDQEPLYRYRREEAQKRPAGRPAWRDAVSRHLPFLGPLFLMWGLTLVLLVWQQDLGAAALFFIVFVAMLYLATGNLAYVFSGLFLLILATVAAYYIFDTVVAVRILSWLNPWPNVADRAFQIVQALYAQAAGGVLGQGIGQGFPDYIPVVHSDFAMAAVAEEWGLAGSLTLVTLFVVLAIKGLTTALNEIRSDRPRYFHAYLAAGLVTLFSVQALLIMGGITRLLPLTGITLPFVSYGGSSMLVSCLAMGMLLYLSAVAKDSPMGRPNDPGLAQRIAWLGVALLVTFATVVIALAWWGIIRSDSLLARDDNPRIVELEQRVRRGRILDHKDSVLAESIGSPEALIRSYPVRSAGPAVGYYSVRYGVAGIEGALDEILRGDSDPFWFRTVRSWLHRPVVGRDVRLTIDAGLQGAAMELMSESGKDGALILLELTEIGGEPVAEIRALASLPAYDPNRIDLEFETLSGDERGPLFNRATRGLYQPGLLLQPLIAAAALDGGALQLSDPVSDPFDPVTINGQAEHCDASPPGQTGRSFTWADMIALRCPAPLRDLGRRLGTGRLSDILTRFGFGQAPALLLPTEASAIDIVDPGLAAIGQESTTVSPLQAGLAMAALAGDGRLPGVRLVDAMTDAGEWRTEPVVSNSASLPIVSPEASELIRDQWPVSEGVSTYPVSVLSGPDGSRNSWYVGLAPASNPRYILVLVLEGETETALAEAIGSALMAEVTD